MNIFRLVADLLHLASIFILLLKITKTRSATGREKIQIKSFVLVVVDSRFMILIRFHFFVPNYLLLLNISLYESNTGISFKTQALYFLVFVTRYVDLFTHFVSLYNSLMKIFFIGSSVYILYLMKVKFRATWDPSLDTLRVEFLIVPSAILALIFNYSYHPLEVSIS